MFTCYINYMSSTPPTPKPEAARAQGESKLNKTTLEKIKASALYLEDLLGGRSALKRQA
jgi:hypothetical protein